MIVADGWVHSRNREAMRLVLLGLSICLLVSVFYVIPKAKIYPESIAVATAKLAASPNTLTISRGENISVSWSRVENPSPKDFIAIYSPSTSADDDYFDTFVPNVPSEQGNFTYFVVNMRTDYGFKYWRFNANSGMHEVAAVGNVIKFLGGPNEPLQGHLSLTGNTDEMRVMWVTDSSKFPPEVVYGTQTNIYPHSATGTSNTYYVDMMCGAPANITAARYFRPPGYHHDALLSGLTPNTVYYYRFGNAKEGYSPEYSFKSPASRVHDPNKGHKFLIYGDMGTYDNRCGCTGALPTAAKITKDVYEGEYSYDFVIHIGDISYGQGRSYIWDQFFHQIEPIATRVPYMVGIGNHDYVHSVQKLDPSGSKGFKPSWGNYHDDSDGECSVPLYYKFHMPDSTEQNKMSPYWYSYDYGLAHFVIMSTEHNFTIGSEQFLWLQNDLAAASQNRQNVPWIIFSGHRPMYESEDYPSDTRVSNELRSNLEDLLYSHKVNLALWGHYHAYQRTCPVYNNECIGDNTNPGGTVHITVGSAGADLDSASYRPVNWTEFATYAWGYSRVSVANESFLYLEFVQTISDGDDDVIDQIWLRRWE